MKRWRLSAGIERLERICRSLWIAVDFAAREKAVETLIYENDEREHIFALLVLGLFVGLPAPPLHLTMALAPLEKVTTAHDPLADLFAVLKID